MHNCAHRAAAERDVSYSKIAIGTASFRHRGADLVRETMLARVIHGLLELDRHLVWLEVGSEMGMGVRGGICLNNKTKVWHRVGLRRTPTPHYLKRFRTPRPRSCSPSNHDFAIDKARQVANMIIHPVERSIRSCAQGKVWQH